MALRGGASGDALAAALRDKPSLFLYSQSKLYAASSPKLYTYPQEMEGREGEQWQ